MFQGRNEEPDVSSGDNMKLLLLNETRLVLVLGSGSKNIYSLNSVPFVYHRFTTKNLI